MRTKLWVPLLVLVCVASGATFLAQSALAQLGTTEAAAREWVQKIVGEGGPRHFVTWDDPQVRPVLAKFKTLPAATKGPLTTQLYAWAKAFFNTPAFKTAYAANRKEQTPQLHEHGNTPADELKAKIAEEDKNQEAMFAMLEKAGQKAGAAENRKQWQTMRPQMHVIWKTEIEEHRAKDKVEYADAMKQWELAQPGDPNVLFARVLREFLDTTADVDFAAKQHVVVGEGGSGLQFVNATYVKKPWQWKFAYEWGPEATAAARAAAAAWLKELGK